MLRDGSCFSRTSDTVSASHLQIRNVDVSLLQWQNNKGIQGPEDLVVNSLRKYIDSVASGYLTEPEPLKSIIRRHVDDFGESGIKKAPKLVEQCEDPEIRNLYEKTTMEMLPKLGKLLNLRGIEELEVTTVGGTKWNVTTYLGENYIIEAENRMRCFTGQLTYLDKMKRNLLNPTARKLNGIPIPCGFEGEYRDTHCGRKEKIGPLELVTPETTKQCQTLLGRTVVALRTGLHLAYAQRRYSSCCFYPMLVKHLERYEKYITENPWIRCLVPSYEGGSFESNFSRSREWGKKLPKFQVTGMADSDFMGETGDISVGSSYVSVNGCPHLFRSFKLP